MTVNQAIEYIIELFPEAGETIILKELDAAHKEYAAETELVASGYLLANISTNTEFALPTGTIKVKRIDYFNSDDEIIVGVPLMYRIEGTKIVFDHIYESITGIPADIARIGLRVITRPVTLAAGSTFGVPEEFHMAVIAKVIEKFHFRYPQLTRTFPDGSVIKQVNIPAADRAALEYREGITRGKRFRNLQDSTPVNIQGYFYAGEPIPYIAQLLTKDEETP